jgi:hypothetical protein
VRSVPAHAGAVLEIEAGLAEARAAEASGPSYAPEAADELLLVAGFIRRPPPEVTVCPLECERILTACREGVIGAGVA